MGDKPMSKWWFNTKITNQEVLAKLSSFEAAIQVRGEEVSKDKMSRLVKARIADKDYFIKYYYQSGRHLRKYIGRSRIHAEFQNLKLFEKLGIATPKLICYGEFRRKGILRTGVLITEGIDNITDLAILYKNQSLLLKNNKWLRQVINMVADYTSRLHQHGFAHNDLKWRNILVTAEPKVYFIDCPQGRRRRGIFLKRGIIKDLACLDKVAKYALSRTMRLRFYLAYTGKKRLTKKDKQQIKLILAFFQGRE